MALCVTQSNNLVLQKQDQRSTALTRYQLGPFGNHQRPLGNHQRPFGTIRESSETIRESSETIRDH